MSKHIRCPFDPEHVGKVVTVQALHKESWDSGDLKTETLVKMVGTLQSYTYVPSSGLVKFKFEGDTSLGVYNLHSVALEVIPRDPGRRVDVSED